MKRLLFLSVIILFASCQHSSIPGLVSARGKVLFDGSPIGGVSVIFTPQPGSSSDRFATAVTKDDGSFVLDTIGHLGALPGQYNVTLSKTTLTPKVSREEEEKRQKANKPIPGPDVTYHIPWKYENVSSSGIVIEIGKQGKTDISIELQPDNTPPPIRPNI